MGDLSEDGMPLNSPLYLFPQTEEQVPLKAWAEERQAEQFIPVRSHTRALLVGDGACGAGVEGSLR
eukprot:COSAG04_NODE_884_length_9654_cov_39.264155_7_plen_66_part_00